MERKVLRSAGGCGGCGVSFSSNTESAGTIVEIPGHADKTISAAARANVLQ